MDLAYYTVAQAAQRLGVCPSTIRRLIGSGRLATVDLSEERAKRRTHRIPAAALANLGTADLASASRHLAIVPAVA